MPAGLELQNVPGRIRIDDPYSWSVVVIQGTKYGPGSLQGSKSGASMWAILGLNQ